MVCLSCLVFLLNLVLVASCQNVHGFTRDDFPSDFVFGAGSSAYQIEGAVVEDGRIPSIWDIYTHAGKMADKSTGDTACDGYHKYKEDVKLLSELGLEAYRFSISWSRLLPRIEPHATIHHLDLPQVLEEEYEGWLSPKIVEDFSAYADVCFREFGDRISGWTTINEPNVRQNGLVGLNLYAIWCRPFTNSTADVKATQRATYFFTGWAVNPLISGDYPDIVKKNAGSRIPSFTKGESKLLKGSFDFIGLNHYLTMYIEDGLHDPSTGPGTFNSDMNVRYSNSAETPPGPIPPMSSPYNPSGMHGVLKYFKDYYGNPLVYVHENGHGQSYNESLNDVARINYLSGYIESILNAIRDGAHTEGYFVWSFLDVFEFLSGYKTRLGLVHVDFENKELRRLPKLSAQWYSNFLKNKTFVMKDIDSGALSTSYHISQ